ncbi:hypothetical protein N7510_003302 [Penicillium lagena]|uniref:uncharacterized protein n=1 Tax=Penicillium lagena TaxID=94218 RepID=UPI002541F3ED|nr:uncharacterized protein N7510_003302 [Penicillium lagena]KAJ5619318.1 hypothetical protein N7510_003302 [Penicillium lagena]
MATQVGTIDQSRGKKEAKAVQRAQGGRVEQEGLRTLIWGLRWLVCPITLEIVFLYHPIIRLITEL